jgi:type VI secretion system protein ImpJ
MRHLPIHWSEGMFLRPHHFQAGDRHQHEFAALQATAGEPCGYGIVRLDIVEDALANRHIELRHCRARLRDGTLIWLEDGEEPDRLNVGAAVETFSKLRAALEDALAVEETVRIYLAVPKFQPTQPNVAPPGPADRSRFIVIARPSQDDVAGGNDQDVEFRSFNVRLLASNQDLSGYELLPIVQIRRSGNREEPPEIDPEYFPPVLSIDAWPPLGVGVVRSIYDLVSRKIEVLAEQAVSRQVGFSSSEPGDLDRLIMLSKLLESQGVLRTLAFAPGIHPRTAYAELCRLAGQLAIFEPERRLEELPLYDHDELARIFRDVKQRIERMLSRIAALAYEQRYFVGAGPATLTVSLEPKWLQSDWRWYVGVLRGEIPETECRLLLSGNKQLDWKLGSSRQVDYFFKMGVPGLQLIEVDRPPRALPDRGGWIYYQISRENVAWNDVQQSQTLAIKLRETLLLNRDSLPGNRRLEVIHAGNPASLEFALFAVPQTN